MICWAVLLCLPLTGRECCRWLIYFPIHSPINLKNYRLLFSEEAEPPKFASFSIIAHWCCSCIFRVNCRKWRRKEGRGIKWPHRRCGWPQKNGSFWCRAFWSYRGHKWATDLSWWWRPSCRCKLHKNCRPNLSSISVIDSTRRRFLWGSLSPSRRIRFKTLTKGHFCHHWTACFPQRWRRCICEGRPSSLISFCRWRGRRWRGLHWCRNRWPWTVRCRTGLPFGCSRCPQQNRCSICCYFAAASLQNTKNCPFHWKI